ncbi:hypothetical protein J5X98_09400 [Leptothermofonsia sichuanensis E412]|nr:hypothetical protein [Leptothermofonsia sichuanensis]QZZ22552.1 hypothetical protein J5X98_09400 [Leptothermofonsia sichuanensis E412]
MVIVLFLLGDRFLVLGRAMVFFNGISTMEEVIRSIQASTEPMDRLLTT